MAFNDFSKKQIDLVRKPMTGFDRRASRNTALTDCILQCLNSFAPALRVSAGTRVIDVGVQWIIPNRLDGFFAHLTGSNANNLFE